MRIRVRRTGGFAGIAREAEVDTSGLADAERVHDLARAALAAEPRESRGVPDGFSYEITVDGRTVTCCDPDLTPEQRELIQRVLKEGA
ncbi:protealysin inhibitor emfourin [Streptomyces sp. SBR177]|uniref:protealysin inhibitor emfourin n=1 Tax=unclassified Streptomyces TaxID=2593676 RepID=UPI0033AA4F11